MRFNSLSTAAVALILVTAIPTTALAQTATPQPAPQLPANWNLPSDAEVAALIDARIAQRRGAGIVVGLLDGTSGRIVARGPAGAGAAFDGRTIFEIGSISKVFTALILADMVSKGEVALDDPAEKYLPAGVKMPERGGRKITLLDLATQTSGLPRAPDNMPYGNIDDPIADYTEALMLDYLGRYQLTRDIGSQFEYSNLGFGLLGYLLGRAARSDYATLLAQRITGPLGMRDTAIGLSADQQRRFAQGHDAYMRPAAPWTFGALPGCGAIRSSGDDMLTFLRAVIDPNSPIGPAMKLAAEWRRPTGMGRLGIGLGWMIGKPAEGRSTLLHNGATGGFRGMIWLEPAKARGVVVLTNAAIEPASDDLALHLMLGTPVQPARPVPPAPPRPSDRVEVQLPPAELDRVVGRYEVTGLSILNISRDGTGLKAAIAGQTLPIFAESRLNFFWRRMDAQAQFTTGADGKVDGVVFTWIGMPFKGKRVAP